MGLQHKGKKAGTIHLKGKWIPRTGSEHVQLVRNGNATASSFVDAAAHDAIIAHDAIVAAHDAVAAHDSVAASDATTANAAADDGRTTRTSSDARWLSSDATCPAKHVSNECKLPIARLRFPLNGAQARLF